MLTQNSIIPRSLSQWTTTVKFKCRVIFRQYIPKKRKRFGIKIYKAVMNQGIHMISECTWVDSHSTIDEKRATHATLRHLTCRFEGLQPKIVMDNFFSFPRLFYDLHICKISSCRIVRPNGKDMPLTLDQNN